MPTDRHDHRRRGDDGQGDGPGPTGPLPGVRLVSDHGPAFPFALSFRENAAMHTAPRTPTRKPPAGPRTCVGDLLPPAGPVPELPPRVAGAWTVARTAAAAAASAACSLAIAWPVAAQAQPASASAPASDAELDALRGRIAAPLMAQPLIGQQPLVPLATSTRLPAHAGPLVVQVSAGLAHDSNVMRAPSALSDRLAVLTAGLRLDKRWSLQRLTLDAEASAVRFDQYGQLDHELANYRSAWEWAFTPRLTGTLSARQTQLRDFSAVDDGTPARADLRTEREQAGDLRLGGVGAWRLEAGASRLRTESDQARTLEANAHIDSARLGVGHRWPSGLDLALRARRGQGHYPHGVGPDFQDDQVDLVLQVPRHVFWSFDARLGQLRRRHDAQAARDFDGAVGQARVAWDNGARTRVEAGLERELGGYDLGAGGQVRAERFFIAPAWQAGARTTLSLRHAIEWRRWSPVDPAAPDAGREDRSRATGLVLDWQPRTWWQLLLQVRGERRGSSLPGAQFRATFTSIAIRVTP